MFSLNGLLRGAGDTIIPMFITLFSLWIIRIPLASLLSGRLFTTLTGWGLQPDFPSLLKGSLAEQGIWWSVPVAWLVGASFSFIYYRTGKWRNKGVIKHKDE